LIERLENHQIQLECLSESPIGSALKDQKFVISGVFVNLSREELKEKIESLGGTVISAISSKTNYVIAGEGIGPSKKSKAEALGIPIIDEKTFFDMINT